MIQTCIYRDISKFSPEIDPTVMQILLFNQVPNLFPYRAVIRELEET